MKTYKLQKDSTAEMSFQIIILFLIIVASFYTLTTIDFNITAFIFVSLFTLFFIAMFISSIIKSVDEKEQFLEVDIEEDRVRFNEKILLFKNIETFTFNHYQEYGNYYGRIYSIVDGEKEESLYSREFEGNNSLSEEMLVEIYTSLEEKHSAYKKKHLSPEKELQTQVDRKKLWGVFEMINVSPRSLYYSYNGNYEVSMFFLLAFALVMTLPAFLINYDTIYFNQDTQELLYELYFFSDFTEYEAHGADVAVIAWLGFNIAMTDLFLKERFKLLSFMSYDGNVIRVGEVTIALMGLFYAFLLIIYFNGEDIRGLWAISLMTFNLILLAFMESKKYKISLFMFVPFLSLSLINIMTLGSLVWNKTI